MSAIRLFVVIAATLAATGVASAQDARPSEEPATRPAAEEARPSEWNLWLRPYFFLAGVSGSVTAEPLTFPINSSFTDLLKDVKIGAFLAFSVEKGPWGLYTDFQYIRLAGEGTSSTTGATLTLDNFIAELDFTFRPPGTPTLRFLAGLRVYALSETLVLTDLSEFKTTTTVYDPVLGAMGEWNLGKDWIFGVRADIGGFGISSEFTYQMMVLFSAPLGKVVSIPFGYRILGYQINSGGVQMNTRMMGLVLGLDIKL